MKWTRNRVVGTGIRTNDAVAAGLAAARRRRIWIIVLVANALALVATVAGCLFMMRTEGVQADVAKMRDEVGESLTMMTLEGSGKAMARHIPQLIDTTDRWNRRFVAKSESFRGMDAEINCVQSMNRLGKTAERWRRELENVSPMQRDELWRKKLKAQVEMEQKKWPNRTHRRGADEWVTDLAREFWYGIEHGLVWPVGLYERTAELVKGGGSLSRLEFSDRLHYIMFPYRLSAFTMLRLFGIAFATSLVGYFLCWVGLRTRFGWLSYVGLVYFLYLLNIALFILGMEITE